MIDRASCNRTPLTGTPRVGAGTRATAVCAALMILCACRAADAPPIVAPSGNDGANLRLDRVVFTQAVQDERGELPLVAGTPAAAKVLVVRSKESVAEVPPVLRLFRGGALVYTDTTRTGGVLGPSRSLAAASADFLIPGTFVAADVSWQIELDPRETVPDSSRQDNRLPAGPPEALRTVSLPDVRARLVPVVLALHGNLTGDVTALNAESYVRLVRASA